MEMGTLEWDIAVVKILEALRDDEPYAINQPAPTVQEPLPEKVPSPFFTAKEAAAYLRKTVKAVYALVDRGLLRSEPGSRRLLFTQQELDRWVKGEKLPTKKAAKKGGKR